MGVSGDITVNEECYRLIANCLDPSLRRCQRPTCGPKTQLNILKIAGRGHNAYFAVSVSHACDECTRRICFTVDDRRQPFLRAATRTFARNVHS